MAERRVVITGAGLVTAAGIGRDALAAALDAGRSCVGAIGRFDAAGFPCRVAGELADFSARDFVPRSYRKSVKVMARDIQIAVAAADLAFRDAGIATPGTGAEASDVPPGRLGCNIGAGLICSDLNELGVAVNNAVVDGRFDLRAWGQRGMNDLTPLWLLKYLPNMLSCHVTILHQAKGPSNTITCGAASSHLAVGEAARTVAAGRADACVAGGGESKLNPLGLVRQHLLGRLAAGGPDDGAACRPFDADHAGTVIGEGGGLLILENADRAAERGAAIHAELAGFGAACDPEGMDFGRPSCGGMDRAVTAALKDAGIGPADVDAIVTHGTGVPGEDDLEAAAWHSALGDRAGEIPAVAVTGCVGLLFAGAGAVELAVAADALRTQRVPATVNFRAPAPSCPLNLSPEARPAALRHVVSAAFGVGGQSGAIVLRRAES